MGKIILFNNGSVNYINNEMSKSTELFGFGKPKEKPKSKEEIFKEKEEAFVKLGLIQKSEALINSVKSVHSKLQQMIKAVYDKTEAIKYFSYPNISQYMSDKHGFKYSLKELIENVFVPSQDSTKLVFLVPLQEIKTVQISMDDWDDIVVDLIPNVHRSFEKLWMSQKSTTVGSIKIMHTSISEAGAYDYLSSEVASMAKFPGKDIYVGLNYDYCGYIGEGDGDEVESLSMVVSTCIEINR